MPVAAVTGAAGFIGRALCARLLQEGWQVRGIDALLNPSAREGQSRLQRWHAQPQTAFHWHPLNLLEDELTPALAQVDCLFHLAALPGVRQSSQQAPEYYAQNYWASLRLFYAARQAGVQRWVFASSSSVYGWQQSRPWHETLPCQPASPYAWSKWLCEQALETQSQHYPLKTVALRLFSVYGPGQRPDMAFRRFAEALHSQDPVEVFAADKMWRDFTYLDDVTQALVLAANYTQEQAQGYDCFNIASGQSHSLNHAIALLENISGHKLCRSPAPRQRGEVYSTQADISRAETILGYSPRVTLEEGLKLYWDGFQTHHLTGERQPCLTT